MHQLRSNSAQPLTETRGEGGEGAGEGGGEGKGAGIGTAREECSDVPARVEGLAPANRAHATRTPSANTRGPGALPHTVGALGPPHPNGRRPPRARAAATRRPANRARAARSGPARRRHERMSDRVTAAPYRWRLSAWAVGSSASAPPPAPDRSALDEALALYGELDALIGQALAAPAPECLRLAARVVNRCDALDAGLDRAGVGPRGGGPTTSRRRDGAPLSVGNGESRR